MDGYGALLQNEYGNIWVSPGSIPIALKSKKTVSLQGGAGYNISTSETFNNGFPCIAFVHTTTPCEITQSISGNALTVNFLRPDSNGTGSVYFFTIFPQDLPSWGIAIWDASGTLVLTNETRTLTDVTKFGTPGVDNASGYNVDTTVNGKWACIPSINGILTGVINTGGQPRPFSSLYKCLAVASGGNTRIYSRPQVQTGGGGLQGAVYQNSRNAIYAIEVSKYD